MLRQRFQQLEEATTKGPSLGELVDGTAAVAGFEQSADVGVVVTQPEQAAVRSTDEHPATGMAKKFRLCKSRAVIRFHDCTSGACQAVRVGTGRSPFAVS